MGPRNKSIFRIHLGLFLAELICIPAFIFEVSRALSGNTVSWAYVVEWPLLGGYAVYMWRKMLREERDDDVRPLAVQEPDDPELQAWNAYLAKIHSSSQDKDPENLAD
jgi:hypothetical protein